MNLAGHFPPQLIQHHVAHAQPLLPMFRRQWPLRMSVAMTLMMIEMAENVIKVPYFVLCL